MRDTRLPEQNRKVILCKRNRNADIATVEKAGMSASQEIH
jgi:hypothetical protein